MQPNNPKSKNALLEKMQADLAQAVQAKPEPIKPNNDVVTLQRDNVKKYKRKPHTSWYPPNDKVLRELNQLALDERVSVNDLIVEGVALLFEKRGKIFENYL